MRNLLACLLCLALSGVCLADITFEGEGKVEAYSLAKVRAKSSNFKSYVYKITNSQGKKVKYERGLDGWLIFTGAPGEYTVEATAGALDKDGNLLLENAEFTVTIGDGKPPKPPDPPDPPKPPDPKDEAPIKAPGNRVLIVYESAELPKLPSKQLTQVYSKALRELLTSKCVTDADNPKGAWRMWDKDVDASGEAKSWQDALKRPRTKLPWILISNGTTGYEGPLPVEAQETLDLLKKHLKE